MGTFEPGAFVRLRLGGKTMVVKHPSTTSQLPDTLLILCEYRAKNRLVQGFYAARDLILAPRDQSRGREYERTSRKAPTCLVGVPKRSEL